MKKDYTITHVYNCSKRKEEGEEKIKSTWPPAFYGTTETDEHLTTHTPLGSNTSL